MKKASYKKESGAGYKRQGGIAVILVVGVLAILTLFTICLAVSMRLEENMAASYSNDIKARYLAEAGINRAIAELKNDARNNFVYTYINKGYVDSSLYGGCGTYSVSIEDEQRKININNTENPNLEQMLKNLNMIIGHPLTNQNCEDIVTNAPYETKEEIMTIPGISETKYKAVKDYITLYAYKDPNCGNRSPINVNTADGVVLMAALFGISDGSESISTDVINLVNNHIIPNRPYHSWKEFNDCIDGSGLSNDVKKQLVKDNCNPNRTKPSTYTTEFCFFSGGKYTLIASGGVYNVPAHTKQLASKRIEAVVDIYDALNQTTKEQFMGSEGDTLPIHWKVNAFDNCPVRGDQQDLYDNGPSAYETIPDSIKIGFWDDFDEDGQNAVFYMHSSGSWETRGTGAADGNVWDGTNNAYTITDVEPDGDNELELERTDMAHIEDQWPGYSCNLGTQSDNNLIWNDFSYSLQVDDVSYVKTRIWPDDAPWNVEFSAYRIQGDNPGNGLCCGFKDMRDDWFPWPIDHDIEYEHWMPGHAYGGSIGNPWQIKKRAKFVLEDNNAWYYVNMGGHNLQSSFLPNPETVGLTSGLVGAWDWTINARIDNIRIIPRSPDCEDGDGIYDDYAHFISTWLPNETGFDFDSDGTPDDVEWGTIWGTVTIPESADPDTEKIYFQTNISASWNSNNPAPGDPPDSSIASPNSAKIQYRANFEIYGGVYAPGDERYRETPVLEDVFITYLPETKVLYWRNQ